ncbi:hypothetical protein DSM112329_00298 [Paraconexibacter sp. AEG42_29]|uniref:Uncharacterized protein n=1 Tax=Paraconexibacter sp. AEG42_29 TaxID=2997339 RepID=A0AAU7APB1_9ACTN
MKTTSCLRSTILLAGLLLAGAAAPTWALAVPTVSVIGDDGQPLPMTAGQAVTVRNVRAVVRLSYPPPGSNGRFTFDLVDATGKSASRGTSFTESCILQSGVAFDQNLQYHGNQTYQAVVKEYAPEDTSCATPTTTTTYGLTVAARVGIAPPTRPFVLSYPSVKGFPLTVTNNPGANLNEIHYALNGVVGPDGDLVAPFRFRLASLEDVGEATTTTQLDTTKPGRYTVVARAIDPSGSFSLLQPYRGDAASPWTPAITVVAKAPFGLTTSPVANFSDFTGPDYTLSVKVTFPGTPGTVSIGIARGKAGGTFRSLGTAKISSAGTITKRIRVVGNGKKPYRLRVSYKGSAFYLPGTQILRTSF